MSDSHTLHDRLPVPKGDLFIHAGDLTDMGSLDDVSRFNSFLGTLPHRHKVVIAGNHDFAFEKRPAEARALLTNCVYLQDSETTVEGVRLWGSPWQPWFYDWAFNLKRGAQIRAKWDLIPDGIGILVTHGPPLGHGDEVPRVFGVEKVGCADLLETVKRVKPRYHVFGHIHEGYGITTEGPTTFVNASLCDAAYRPVNPPIVLDW